MNNERFYKTTSTIEKYRIYDDDKEDAYFISCDEHTVDCLTDLLNELNTENTKLKKALLFFIDVANTETSSRYSEDMENDCQKIFNCSHKKAQEKYGGWEYE